MVKNKLMFLLFIGIMMVYVHGDANIKKINCRKYVFAPMCRGVAAKRDLQKLEPLLESPKVTRCYHITEEQQRSVSKPDILDDTDSDTSTNTKQLNELLDNPTLVEALIKKITTKNYDYDSSGTNKNYIN